MESQVLVLSECLSTNDQITLVKDFLQVRQCHKMKGMHNDRKNHL
jgi:hypothetical protein